MREHPEGAGEVRARVARLRALGLLEEDGASDAVATPERLGGFRLVERLGEGGMGVVWVAEESALGRRVALKMIRPELLWFDGARERFRREVEAIGRLQHAGIVPVYAAGEEGGVPFFTMELLDGRTLADVVDELRGADPARLSGADLARALGGGARGPLFEQGYTDACLAIARQVAEALDHAHGRGVVHRDVKPSNVALTRSGRAMLLDFGLVRTETADRVTRSNSQPGSLPYMAPEQVEGAAEIDARADVYSLGATLYELLTLRRAFDAPTLSELGRIIRAGDFLRPRAHVPGLAWDVETVCTKALSTEPRQRYASADDLARDLGNLLERRPIEARRAGPALRLLRWAQRHPRASAALVAALPLGFVALAALAWVERARGAEILRLADVQRLSDLRAEAEALWPAAPELVEDCEAWLARADELALRLPRHRARLAELESDASLDDEGTLEFGRDEERWQHATLAGLVAGVEELADPHAGLASDVRARLAFASTIEERSLDGPDAAARWAEAAASIADRSECPDYRGLALAPQLGLLPIGRDPESGLWEFAHLASGAPAERDSDGRLALGADAGIVLVLLPGGAFRMGSVLDAAQPDFDAWGEAEETPAHEVELAPFFLGKHLVTEAQWARLAGEALDPAQARALLPRANVSWLDCERVLGRAALALPTEAQWEYGARAGTTTPWWTGDEPDSLYGAANLLDQSLRRAGKAPAGVELVEFDDGFVETSPVDALAANPFGLHDAAGNVMQWCRDRYALYSTPPDPGDGERHSDATENRILRGGACVTLARMARAANRAAQPPDSSTWALGLRAARRVDPPR